MPLTIPGSKKNQVHGVVRVIKSTDKIEHGNGIMIIGHKMVNENISKREREREIGVQTAVLNKYRNIFFFKYIQSAILKKY